MEYVMLPFKMWEVGVPWWPSSKNIPGNVGDMRFDQLGPGSHIIKDMKLKLI